MAIFKCKMCGGDLNISADDKIVECEYCGTTQTVPNADNEKKMTLFNRANRLRLNSEFDKAAVLYEQIIAEFPEEAEAYWGLCLCNYGIEYVDDPATGKKMPTCHRASFQKLREDENFNLAMEYSDAIAQKVYRDEAREIDRINAEILSVSRNEKPYDVFICYKETDDFGCRTPDSVMAQEVYDALTDKGYKVFFSRITLEDKLGLQYEPYIFAALNSAKVMLAFGTKYEYFHAVWVKNEWSRFLKLAAKDKTKKLVPVYKDMDPYDLPDELKALQAQDMNKLGAVQDLVRGVGKLLPADALPVAETVVSSAAVPANVAGLLERAFLFLEDGKWTEADEYCEKVLDISPKCAEAYLGKLMATLCVCHREQLQDVTEPFDQNDNCIKASRFDERIAKELADANACIREQTENARKEKVYQQALAKRENKTENSYRAASELFASISGYKDADERAKQSAEDAETTRKECVYRTALHDSDSETVLQMEKAAVAFESIADYKDARQRAEDCHRRADAIPKESVYLEAKAAQQSKKYTEALKGFESISEFKDSKTHIAECHSRINSITQKRDALQPVLAAGSSCVVAVRSDGFVVFETANNKKTPCNVGNWNNTVAVAVGKHHIVGLMSNGDVVATGKDDYNQCAVKGWTDCMAIAAGDLHTVALRDDGTVIATGNNKKGQCDVSGWSDIVRIFAGDSCTVGLKSDGTLVTRGIDFDVQNWTDIVSVAIGKHHIIGLHTDGTVVALGKNSFGECNVENWTEILAVAVGEKHTVGLCADGTVVATGDNKKGQCSVDTWKDVANIDAAENYTIGIKTDGTVEVSACSVPYLSYAGGWKHIRTTDEYTKIVRRAMYWRKHTDEKKQLKAERIRLYKECLSFASQRNRLRQEERFLTMDSRYTDFERQISEWRTEKEKFGLFKVAERKELQSKIDRIVEVIADDLTKREQENRDKIREIDAIILADR